MTTLAPYTNAMRLGQGFNTYTQDIRLSDAVKVNRKAPPITSRRVASGPEVAKKVAQYNAKDATLPSPPGTPRLNGERSASTPTIKARSASRGPTSAPPDSPALSAMSILGPARAPSPFNMEDPSDPPPVSQSVTFSTRAIENVSDIMDALNISTAMSIGYGTIHGNGSAAFVNENKVLDSELNYIVSVSVSNDNMVSEPEEMEFQPIDEIPPETFTQVYGDSFISGFEEGGVFNAIISIQVNDKRKLREVKQAVDVQLAVGPVPVDVGVKEKFEKSHMEALQDTEITISVNWTGGGEVKKPEVPWTLASVVAVANAFPSMVARSSSKTQAILTRYTALKSFQQWKWKMAAKDPAWLKKFVILNYAPCSLYTNDLFDAMMSYKKLWKKISEILKNPAKFQAREPDKKNKYITNSLATDGYYAPNGSRKLRVATSISNMSQASDRLSPCEKRARGLNINHANTFEIDDGSIEESWDLYAINHDRTPIPIDPLALNEAKLLCREAMTLIVQEASRLVDHPHLAYAEFNPLTGKTQMKRPDFAFPEVLKMRLPIPIANDASADSANQDPSAIMTSAYARDNDLYCHLIGDPPLEHRTYKSFTSLDLNETRRGRVGAGAENPLRKICLHSYHHSSLSWSQYSADADGAIGAIGFGFARDDPAGDSRECQLHHYGHPSSDRESTRKILDLGSKAASAEVTRVDICYVPGTGRIGGIVFYDDFVDNVTERLALRQWRVGKEPAGLQVVTQEPPDDGERWRFVGVCGEFDSAWSGEVLARVSGIWRRV